MKAKLLKSVAFLLVLTVGFTSCKKPDQPPTGPSDPETEYPAEVALTERYIQCMLKNLEHRVFIINSDEELQNFILCNYNMTAIDFSKYTLLLTGGMSRGLVCSNTKQATFSRDTDTVNEYVLKINLRTGTTVENTYLWSAAYLIPKLPKGITVTSDITYEPYYDDTYFPHDGSASIIGKWKLAYGRASVYPIYPLFMTDYSASNVVYEFKPGGILTITGERELPHPLGDNTYAFEDDEDNEFSEYPYGLTINNGPTSWYRFNSEKLVIDDSPLGGLTYCFVKIN